MRRSFAPPVFAAPEQTLRAGILHLVIGVTCIIAVAFLPLIVIMQPGTTLAGGIAHDFNNLLAMIGTNAELGLVATREGDQARTSFDEIVTAAARGKDVVRQILVFSRRQDSERRPIWLQPVVEDALSFLRATLPTNVELRATVDPEVPRVSANASQVYQILMKRQIP